jgi:hypothetical protein
MYQFYVYTLIYFTSTSTSYFYFYFYFSYREIFSWASSRADPPPRIQSFSAILRRWSALVLFGQYPLSSYMRNATKRFVHNGGRLLFCPHRPCSSDSSTGLHDPRPRYGTVLNRRSFS